MPDQNDLNKPDLGSSYNNEVLETLRGHIARLWTGTWGSMAGVVNGMLRWEIPGGNVLRLWRRNGGGTDDLVFDSTSLLGDGTVTTPKLANGAVTPGKLSAGAPSWDTSGNFGIGFSSPTYRLDLRAPNGALARFTETASGFGRGFQLENSGNTNIINSISSGFSHLVFSANSFETARLSGDGAAAQLLLGTSTDNLSAVPQGLVLRASNVSSKVNATFLATQYSFWNPNGMVGSINTQGSTTSYTSLSDYRLKQNVKPMKDAIKKLQMLKPCTFLWKTDGTYGEGFIAHELAEVVPCAVSGQKDAINEDGSILPQSVDASFLVALLTAAIQEQQKIIVDLVKRVQALES